MKLKEWESALLTMEQYSQNREFWMQLKEKNIISLDFIREGVRVSANSMVGDESSKSIHLTIRPKITNFSILKMIGIIHGFIPIKEDHDALAGKEKIDFQDLLIYQWLMLVEQLVPKMRKAYTLVNRNESYVKGKFNFRELSKKGYVGDTIPLQYHQLQMNQILNQLIKTTLLRISGWTANPLVLRKAAQLQHYFTNIDTTQLHVARIEQALTNLNRTNEFYRPILTYLIFILERIGADQGRVQSTGIWINMNQLFQRYMTVLFERYTTYKIEAEVSYKTVFKYELEYNPLDIRAINIRPDLLVYENHSIRNVVDFKYKNYSEKAVSTSDLYQLSTYGLSLGKIELHPLILYPVNHAVKDQVIQVNLHPPIPKQFIIVRGVNLTKLEQLLDTRQSEEVRAFLYSLISQFSG